MNERLTYNQQIIDEFRANNGVCGGRFEGMPMVLITMTGAKSGRTLTSPLVCSTDGDDVVIIASMGGAPTHPNWYYNLVANPTITVELGADTYEATAIETTGEERDRLYAAQAEMMPFFAEYAVTAAPRVIPVFRLTRNA